MAEGVVTSNNPAQSVATPGAAAAPAASPVLVAAVASQQTVVPPTQMPQVPVAVTPQPVPVSPATVPPVVQQPVQPVQQQIVQTSATPQVQLAVAPVVAPAAPVVKPVQVSETKAQAPAPAAKSAVQEVSVPTIKKVKKKKKKFRFSNIFLWILGILVLAILGVFLGMELYQRIRPEGEGITEESAANGEETSEETETPVQTMTVEEIQALIDTGAMDDSLREIEDAAVDIDATNTIIDENLEENDDPPEL